MSENINELRNNMLNKILHYIDKDVLYIEDNRIDKYTPIDCIELFFNISNNMVISNSISKDLFTKNIRNIISKIDKINDNYIQISQMLIVLRKSIESIDNTYDKKSDRGFYPQKHSTFLPSISAFIFFTDPLRHGRPGKHRRRRRQCRLFTSGRCAVYRRWAYPRPLPSRQIRQLYGA